MKYLKTYKIFESVNTINWDLIDDAKDIALEYVDEYMILNYFICSSDGKRVFYGGDLRNDGSKKAEYVKYNGEPVAYKILICSKPYDKNLGTTNHPNIVQFNDSLEKETKEVVDRLRSIYPDEDIVGLRRESVLESVFVSKEDVDELLDKINKSGITSLSDIDKNRLTLFSEGDKEIIETIEKMADITNQFRELNDEMRRCQDSGESDGFHLMKDWMKLNNQLRPLEASFRKWGIELGDPRLDRLMRKVRPDAYNRHVIESVKKFKKKKRIKRYSQFKVSTDKQFTWSPDFNKNSPAPSSTVAIAPLK